MFVKNKTTSVINVGGMFILRPGVNEVDGKAWAEAQKIDEVKSMLGDEGRLEVVSGAGAEGARATGTAGAKLASTGGTQVVPADEDLDEGEDEGDTEDAPQSLSDMNAPEAAALVGETNDPATLKRWAKEEQRVTVKAAIEKQLERLAT